MTASPDPTLVAHRQCGPCTVCCVALSINDSTLKKLQGHRCPNTLAAGGCGIYPSRPTTCAGFFCGWRHLKWIAEPLRPDLSNVLVQLHEDTGPDGTGRTGVIFTLIGRQSLKAAGLAESVAAAVASGTPTFVNIPGPPGHTSAMARVNDLMRSAVAARDKPEVLALLRDFYHGGRSGPTQRMNVEAFPPPEV